MNELIPKIKKALEIDRLSADLIVTNINNSKLTLQELLNDASLAKGIFSKLEFNSDFLIKTALKENISLEKFNGLLSEDQYSDLEYTLKKEQAAAAEARRIEQAAAEEARKREQAAAKREAQKQLFQDIQAGRYANEQIQDLVYDGIITRDELRSELGWSYEKIADVMEDMADVLQPPPLPDVLKSVLPTEDRTDVFTFGVSGSGKSLFLGALFAYAESIGKYRREKAHKAAALYADFLMNCVKRGQVLEGTNYEFGLFMSITFKDKKDHEEKKFFGLGKTALKPKFHPLNFIELSGEFFEDVYDDNPRAQECMQWLKGYLGESKNKKIFFFVVDYFLHLPGKSSGDEALKATQSQQLINALSLLRQEKALKDTLGVCLLITKWDRCENPSPQAAKDFLEKHYRNLYETCQDLTKEYRNLKFKVFTFSLGNVSKRNTYAFEPKNSAGIFDWLCDLSHYELIEPEG